MSIAAVFPGHPSAQVSADLAQRLIDCGCEVLPIDQSKPLTDVEQLTIIDQCDVVVIPISGAVLSPPLITAINQGAAKGKRICGVWLSGTPSGNIPNQIEDLSDADVAWDSEDFCKVICGGAPVSQNPDGSIRSTPHNPHHKCS